MLSFRGLNNETVNKNNRFFFYTIYVSLMLWTSTSFDMRFLVYHKNSHKNHTSKITAVIKSKNILHRIRKQKQMYSFDFDDYTR